ncbi:hypothetical protein FOMPIDRAFT_1161920, partial [Fomitopsis schrenkii]
MVLVAEKKYACEACIKGHRASVCQHSDRQLFEIKRKGRPVSQCQHCRDLRKTKQVHVRCTCALRSSDEGDTTDPACQCDQTGECNCCTIRTPYSGRKPKARDSKASVTPERSQSQAPTITPVDIVGAALVNGKRPILPKPMDQQHVFAPVFPPSHASGSNLQLDPQPTLHSCCSGPSVPPMAAGHAPPYVEPVVPQETHFTHMTAPSSDPNAYAPDLNAWLTMFTSPTPVEESAPAPPPSWTVDNFSLCECGSGCGCSACPEHGSAAGNGSSSCSGPDHDTCSSCLDCALVSVPLPQTNHLGVQESGHLPLDFAVDG